MEICVCGFELAKVQDEMRYVCRQKDNTSKSLMFAHGLCLFSVFMEAAVWLSVNVTVRPI